MFLFYASMYETDLPMFQRLAQQSAALSSSHFGLYDTHAGSGIPGDVDLTKANTPQSPAVIQFRDLDDNEVRRIGSDLLI